MQPIPCQRRDPESKGIVEASVRYVKSNALAGSAASRAGRAAMVVSAHMVLSLLQEAPPVVHQPVEQGPGRSVIPIEVGPPLAEGLKSVVHTNGSET